MTDVTTDNESDRRAAVYRLYAADGTLLYVGSAYDPKARWRVHREKPWATLVARRTEVWYPDRLTAYVEERAAIKAELPKFNIVDNPEAPRREPIASTTTMLRSLEREVENISSIEDDVAAFKAASDLLDDLRDLPSRLRAVRQHRVQRLKGSGRTWGQIGASLGVTAARAQQIASGVNGNTRRALTPGGGQPRKPKETS